MGIHLKVAVAIAVAVAVTAVAVTAVTMVEFRWHAKRVLSNRYHFYLCPAARKVEVMQFNLSFWLIVFINQFGAQNNYFSGYLFSNQLKSIEKSLIH